MSNSMIRTMALMAALVLPGAAMASTGVATGSVNMRTGPGTNYARIQTVPNGAGVEIYGCLSNRSWCDVAFAGTRGWVSANYVARLEGRRVYSTPYAGVPTVSFSFGTYNDRHYRNRPWYRDRNWSDNRYRRDHRRSGSRHQWYQRGKDRYRD